jgi:hypothetical protein
MGDAVSQSPAGGLLARAGRWFVESGIQEPGGGVARYYRIDAGRNARISTEITGYAVSTFVWLFEATGREHYLERARCAARFLVDQAWDPELHIFPFEHGVNGDVPEPLAYYFDSGIIARGLLALYRTTREERWLDAATAAGQSMLTDFTNGDDIRPILQLPSKRPVAYESQWSRSPGCYQLKSALAWHDLASVTGEARYASAFADALRTALATHDDFLPAASPDKTMDRLHAYCYFLEALLPIADRGGVRDALRAGIDRVGHLLHEIAPVFVRSDVYAQLLRLRIWADAAGISIKQKDACGEAQALLNFELVSDDPRLTGGFAFGRRGTELLPFANPVSTAFAAQALSMWQDRLGGHRPLSHHQLI